MAGDGAKPEGRVHVLVSGRVQGVGYRWNAVMAAESLGVVGTVRNLTDGGVEIVAEGTKADLQRLINWAREGPPGARVVDLQAEWQPPTGAFRAFRAVH